LLQSAYERIDQTPFVVESVVVLSWGGRTEHSAIPACKQLGWGWRWQHGMFQLILILVCLSPVGRHLFSQQVVFYAPSPAKINTSFSAVPSSPLHGIAIYSIHSVPFFFLETAPGVGDKPLQL
jgi:hypothetical protein